MSSYDKIFTVLKNEHDANKASLRAELDSDRITVAEWEQRDDALELEFEANKVKYMGTDPLRQLRTGKLPEVNTMDTNDLVHEWVAIVSISNRANVMPAPAADRVSKIMQELYNRGLVYIHTPGDWQYK